MSIFMLGPYLPSLASGALEKYHTGSFQGKLTLSTSFSTSVHTFACIFILLAKPSITFIFQHLVEIFHPLMFPFRLFLDVHAIPLQFFYVIKTPFLSFSWQLVSLNLPSSPSAPIWTSWLQILGAPFFVTGVKFKSCAETLTQLHSYTIIKTQSLSPFPDFSSDFQITWEPPWSPQNVSLCE